MTRVLLSQLTMTAWAAAMFGDLNEAGFQGGACSPELFDLRLAPAAKEGRMLGSFHIG